MTFTKEMIDEYANKLLIGLTDEENEMVREEFSVIDRDIAKINEIPNIKDTEPMSWCLDRTISGLREDVCEESIPLEDLLANCDNVWGDTVMVTKVVE